MKDLSEIDRQFLVERHLMSPEHVTDPEYKGFVVSNWTQPVYYAGMKHFDSKGTRDLFLELRKRGVAFKYFILQGELEGWDAWAQEYVDEHGWPIIHRDAGADIRIYQDPQYGERGEQPVPAPSVAP